MRTLFLSIILFTTFTIGAKEPFVQVYSTHDNGMFGRSEDRDITLKIEASVFKRSSTFPVDESMNFLTAVVLSSKTKDALEALFTKSDTAQIGFVKIIKQGNIYTVEDDNIFLSFSFSLEKADDKVLSIIESHYKAMAYFRKIVTEHYMENYIIRVHSAENILKPEAREITYDEALIMATIIGDKEQWLWGIHDGRGYLEDLLFQ